MKALIIYGSYGCDAAITEVEKEMDKNILSSYRQPEYLYKVSTILLSCRSKEIEYSKILGADFNYFPNSIGFTSWTESYVYPITEEQANNIIKTYKSEAVKKKEEYEKALEKAKSHYQEILNKAIQTGEKQVLSRRMVICNDLEEECSMDVITEYLYPDKKIEEIRVHTY